LKAAVHDRINVSNNPVNWIDPYGLEYSRWNTTPYDADYGGGSGGFAPPPATPEQTHRNAHECDDEYPELVLAEIPIGPGSIANLTKSQLSRIRHIEEIAHNWNVRKTLSGELLDPGHIKKIKEGVGGLQKHSQSLQNSLNNPNINAATREVIQKAIDTATGLINRAKSLVD